MSMIRCPECQSEISALAAACPKCGYPLLAEPDTVIVTPAPPVVTPPPPPVVVRKIVTEEKNNFPVWALVPIALALVVVTFGFIWMLSRGDEQANTNDNANLRIAATGNSRPARTTEQTATTLNPPTSADPMVAPPTNSYPSNPPPNAPASNLPPANSETVVANPPLDKGDLMLTATILTSKGAKQPVKAEKFYLLSKDLETILSGAGVEATEGSYASTLGAAIADSNRRDDLQKCLAAINPYIVARTLSDATGNASFKNVKPSSYYLFGVHKVGNSASVWNTNVTINPGENTIALNGSAPAAAAPDAADSNY